MNSDEDKPAEAAPQAPVQATPSTTTEAPHKPQTIDAQAQRVEDPVRKD